MRIAHYLYNAFLVEDGDAKVALDPDQNAWTMGVYDALRAVERIDPEFKRESRTCGH